ncbi:MAG: oligopeptidase B [Maribacter sp.]|jgi:oligopeptidase B
MKPPIAKKLPQELTIHNDTRIDDYFWMRERDHEDVIAYLNEENAYREKVLAHTTDFQEKLFEEIKGRIKQTDMSVPYQKKGYTYYTRFEEGKEYPIHCRKLLHENAVEKVLINVNELAKGKTYYNAAGLGISPNNKILSFGEDTISRRIYTIRFKDLETGEFLADEIPGCTGSVAWANDNKTIFYTLKDSETLRSHQVMRHELGTPITDDVEIFNETDDTFLSFCYKTRSGKYIIIASYHSIMTEYHFLDADNPIGDFTIVQPRERDHEYSIDHYEDRFFIHTNWKAKNFRLMETNIDQVGRENWIEKIPHRDHVLLEDIEIFKEYLVLNERINGITEIRVIPKDGDEYYIPFEEKSHLIYASTNPEFDTTTLRFGYTSMTTPNSIYDFNMNSQEKILLKQTEVISDTFNAEDYASERLWATANDGTQIPISLVYKKGYKKDGKAPLLLYAYGSYGHSMDPYFSSVRLSLLDRGFAYAIAHIRGGEEMGRKWYEDGKMLNKKNTFTDFINCGEFLIAEKYTSSDALFAMGGSAGGLLMGAVMNMRPDLWKGVVSAVPFVDVINTMLDDTIPLTTGEYDEWGNPNDEKYYHYIKSYSPYDNVTAQDYPNTLVTTGYHDSQVQYWEPAKWVAKLREYKTDANHLLFYCNMDSGHGGASGRFSKYKEVAMEYAFLLDLVGISE